MAKQLDDLSTCIEEVYIRLKAEGKITLSTEKIAYTPQFEQLYAEVEEQFPDIDETAEFSGRNVVFMRLRNISKQGRGTARISQQKDREDKLSLSQLRILKALARHPSGLTRDKIASTADVPKAMTGILGPVWQEDVRELEKQTGRRTLMGRGMVKGYHYQCDVTQRDIILYQITPLGEKALRSLLPNSKVKSAPQKVSISPINDVPEEDE